MSAPVTPSLRPLLARALAVVTMVLATSVSVYVAVSDGRLWPVALACLPLVLATGYVARARKGTRLNVRALASTLTGIIYALAGLGCLELGYSMRGKLPYALIPVALGFMLWVTFAYRPFAALALLGCVTCAVLAAPYLLYVVACLLHNPMLPRLWPDMAILALIVAVPIALLYDTGRRMTSKDQSPTLRSKGV